MHEGRTGLQAARASGRGVRRRETVGRWELWPLALWWLPVGVPVQAAVRFGPDTACPRSVTWCPRIGVRGRRRCCRWRQDRWCSTRPAAGARLPEAVASRLPAGRPGAGNRTRPFHGGGVDARGVVGSGGGRRRCGRAQPARVDRMAVAGDAGAKAARGRISASRGWFRRLRWRRRAACRRYPNGAAG